MNNPETMARLIKSIMKQNGISNKELSDNVQKVNVNTISQLSNGREVSYVILANIAEYLGCSVDYLLGRTDIQCRERWCNILDPSLEDVEWTNEEDLKLLNLYRKYKNKWSLIAKHYGNRTDNTCWRRWKYLTCINFSKSNAEGFSNSNINDINGMSKFILDKGLGLSQEINSSHVSEFNDLGKKMPFKVVNAGKK